MQLHLHAAYIGVLFFVVGRLSGLQRLTTQTSVMIHIAITVLYGLVVLLNLLLITANFALTQRQIVLSYKISRTHRELREMFHARYNN